MATNSGISHYSRMELQSCYNHHLVPFQTEPLISSSALVPSSSALLPVGLAAAFVINGTPGAVFPGSPNGALRSGTVRMIPAESSSTMSHMMVTMPAGNSLCNVPVQDPMANLAVDWRPSEQAILDEGLRRFADARGIMKYVKIAAYLNDKTVRDVALRCQYMACRRQEENSNWTKAIDRKEKVSHCAPQSLTTQNHSMHGCPSEMIERDQKHGFLSEVSIADEMIHHLCEQNEHIFSQVVHNQENFKLQDNINLLCCARNNITTIANRMNEMMGVMCMMPPLPVAIREDLADTILLDTTKNMVISDTSATSQLEQEFYYG